MMRSKADLPADQLVLRREHIAALACRFLVGRLQPPQRQIDPFARDLPVARRKTLGQDKFVRQSQHVIQYAHARFAGIILDRQHRGEFGPACPASLDGIKAEAQPLVGNMIAEIGALIRSKHRSHLAIVKRGEEFQRFRTDAGSAGIATEFAHAVLLQRRTQPQYRAFQIAQRFLIDPALFGPPKAALEAFEQPRFTARWAAQDRQEQFVGEQRLPVQPPRP